MTVTALLHRAAVNRLLPLVALVAVSACSGGEQATVQPETPTEVSTAVDAPAGDLSVLPERAGPRRETTGDVPHVQIGVERVPEVEAELRRRAFLLPGVEERASARSLPGARALWLTDEVETPRADVLGGSRELAHIHPDGSLHVWLPVDRAREVHRTKWGELHPWVGRARFWEGVVMVYSPETLEEVDVTIRILVDAYNFVTGAGLDARDVT